ncbi:DNA helicase [Quillaja saponaria]|uniref:DNA helicase n=1 Tax=Quillaja saponaria TaxID=32244 RepID=A0AAD7QBK8_QUISA|nr:DNA helicase [Quillaja saponaria]
MASDSSPPNLNNGPSSPEDSFSSPIENTFSSPDDAARRRRQRRSSTPSAFATPPLRFGTNDATPIPSHSRQREGVRRASSTTPNVATPTFIGRWRGL